MIPNGIVATVDDGGFRRADVSSFFQILIDAQSDVFVKDIGRRRRNDGRQQTARNGGLRIRFQDFFHDVSLILVRDVFIIIDDRAQEEVFHVDVHDSVLRVRADTRHADLRQNVIQYFFRIRFVVIVVRRIGDGQIRLPFKIRTEEGGGDAAGVVQAARRTDTFAVAVIGVQRVEEFFGIAVCVLFHVLVFLAFVYLSFLFRFFYRLFHERDERVVVQIRRCRGSVVRRFQRICDRRRNGPEHIVHALQPNGRIRAVRDFRPLRSVRR